MNEENSLSAEDQARVDQVINAGYNRTERQPFRPLRLLAVLWVVVAILGAVSWYIGKQSGFL
ncbi:MAG: DUF3094 family protein [Porticoccaceae bacterium]|jgi:hypothetical protein|tara:strand:- start:210 stop:395 length:186 start_codon:yes stop_codon:yes gene_type:complete